MSTNIQNTDKTLVESVRNSIKTINKEEVKHRLKELELAYKYNDVRRLYDLSDYFTAVNSCLGNETRDQLLESLKSIKLDILKQGETPLNIAKRDYINAKLAIIKYRQIIIEAANYGNNNNYEFLYKRLKDKRDGIITGVAIASVVGLLSACGVKNSIDNKNTTATTTTSGITSTSTSDTDATSTYDSEDINSVYESTNEGYSIETLDIDYSSPTRETTIYTDATGGSYVDTNRKDNKTSTTRSVRPTTRKDQVDVISKPTNSSDPLTYETTAVETNNDGVKVDNNGETVPTTSYIKPTGTDPLPIEPTKKTLSQEELMGETKVTEAPKTGVKVLVFKLQ